MKNFNKKICFQKFSDANILEKNNVTKNARPGQFFIENILTPRERFYFVYTRNAVLNRLLQFFNASYYFFEACPFLCGPPEDFS